MLILASKSPRRCELLKFITENFEIKSADVDESLPSGISPKDAVLYLSKIKAEPFKNDKDTIIGSDTVVAIDGNILGKPKDENDAIRMLKMLSGKEHSVFTGVTIIAPTFEKSFYNETKVKFYELSDDDINRYLATGEYKDKAGSYGIQGFGSVLVEKINGDYFSVVGLPVSHLYNELKQGFNK